MASNRELLLTRRYFFGKASAGLGIAALANLLGSDLGAAELGAAAPGPNAGLPGLPHFTPKAKRVIYLFQSGGPSQMELFDYKPRLHDMARTELPDSVRMGQRLTGMTSTQTSFPVAPSLFKFQQHGNSGAWVSELMPHFAKVSDDICFIKSMYTEAINHDPAVTFFQTGFQLAGRPVDRRLALVWAGQRKQRPPGIRGDDLAGKRQSERSAAGRPAVGQRILADEVSGREVPLAGRSGALSVQSRGFHARAAPAIHRRSRAVESTRTRRVRRSRDRDAHRAVRNGVQDANFGAGAGGSVEGAGAYLRAVRTGRTQARHVRGELFARAPAGRARSPLRPALSPRLGPAHESALRRSRGRRRTRIRHAPRWYRI